LVVLSVATAGYGGQRFGVYRRPKPAGPKFVPGEVIVKFKAWVGRAAIGAVHRRHGTAEIYTSPFAGFKRVRIPRGKTIAQMVAALRKEASVEYAEPNSICHAFMIPNDPYYPDQWHLDDSSDPNPYGGANGGGINVEPAWDVSQGAGVIVAVIDTGAAYETRGRYLQAPDLANTTFVPGYNFVKNSTHPNDDDGHGTHVTGTIAQSTNNNLGVAGVAFQCSIMPLKVLNQRGYGDAATVADALYFAADNGAKVINMSLGWPVTNGVPYDPGQTVLDAATYAYNQGVTIVCASGNDGEPAVGYPAAYDQYCIAVGATRYDETRPGYSNYGSSLDLVAPGGDVTVDQNNDGYGDGVLQNTMNPYTGDVKDFGYWYFDGTSMAAPHVSGVAALVIAKRYQSTGQYPSPDEVRAALEATAEDKGPQGWDKEYGAGIVDAAAALQWEPTPISIDNVEIAAPANPQAVPRYSKVELLITLSNVAATKFYDPDPASGGLDLSAEFIGPSDTWTVPGFYDGSSWRIRFAPNETGEWSFTVSATDSSGTDTWSGGSFTCISSAYPGWARIDGHYLRFTEGQVLFAVGHNNGWQTDVEQPTLAEMASKGENLLSFWIAAPWYKRSWGPEWAARTPIENVEQGIGEYNQDACAYLDGVVARAEAAGVYLLPTIWSHGQLRVLGDPWPEGWWDNNAYNTECSATDFFKTSEGGGDTPQWRYQKNFYRYLIARWGYSRAIAGWVGLCEIDGTTGYAHNSSQAEAWCVAVRDYFRANDPFRRNAADQHPLAFTKVNDASWGDGDLRATDNYAQETSDIEVAAAIGGDTETMWDSGKPGFHAEFGGYIPGASQPAHLHNGIWAGTAAGAAMTPLVWCDGEHFPMLTSEMRNHLQYLAEFMVGIDSLLLGKPGLAPATLDINDPNCRAWGMQLDDQGFAWIQNTNGTMGDQTLTISGLPAGLYSVLWYDVWTSGSTQMYTDTAVVGTDGILSAWIPTPTPSQADIAVKFASQPTVALVSAFGAHTKDRRVVVEWETASEVDTVGFYVLRRDKTGGKYKKVGDGLLPGLLHSSQGGRYRLVDSDVEPGETYNYKLVEVEVGGGQRHYGPCRVRLDEEATGSPRGEWAKRDQEREARHYRRVAHGVSVPSVPRTSGANRPADASRVRRRRRGARSAVKIGVRERGLYYLDARDVAPLLGIPTRSVENLMRVGRFSLSCQGRSVAYLPAEGGAGIYFYGQGIDSIYTEENVYWLELGRGVQMTQAGESGATPAGGFETFSDTVHAEQNRCPATGLFHDPEADFWLWAYLISGTPGMDKESFTVRADCAAAVGTAALTVRLKGATNTDAEPDHHARIAVNGTTIGEGRWEGTESCILEFTFRQELLVEGANTVTVEGVLDTGAPYSIFYVDSFDLTYQRRYEAVGESLLCRGDENPVVTIAGFSEPGILVFEVTDPWRPMVVTGTTVDECDGSYRVSLTPDAPESVYLALTREAVKRPASLRADVPSRLKWRGNRAAYVVIAPAALKEAARSLAGYREGRGLPTMVADLEDIYDEFNHGIASPKAIQSFLARACREWRESPRYVVLAGHGTWDYKDYLGFGGNLVPPLLVNTAYGLFASDSQFAPQLAIGRLPARAAGGLTDLVHKIIAYERSEGNWAERVLMVADDPDAGGNFPRDSDDLASLLPAGYLVEKVYLSEFPLAVARERLIGGINEGALLVNYIGHAGMDRWAHEGLLTSGDVGTLSNGNRLPVVTALTCVSGRFAFPGYDCIGETLVMKTGGGAIAFWGPSGLSLNSEAKALGEGFIQGAFGRRENLLGDAALNALRRGRSEASKIYNLLGDPALRWRRAK